MFRLEELLIKADNYNTHERELLLNHKRTPLLFICIY